MIKRNREENKFNKILKETTNKTKKNNSFSYRLPKDQQIYLESSNKQNNNKQKS